jgi:cell division initiation protein
MLTPIDIDNKTFKKSKFGGYNINDVETFLVEVMNDYEILYKSNAELKDKVSAMQESLSYYKSLEEGVNRSVENAYSEADELKKSAEKEAEIIKKEAKIYATQEKEEIKSEILKKQVELEEIKKQMQIYKIKEKSMLEAQLKILEENLE